jgi:hypothetical protein
VPPSAGDGVGVDGGGVWLPPNALNTINRLTLRARAGSHKSA